jgi:hypothetical protein
LKIPDNLAAGILNRRQQSHELHVNRERRVLRSADL